ncbi:MAG: leucyl-tRNA synthetase [Elusimicrobia bacterium]|nr:MAG: leucyl-tRNA synthetase [Elusimicrobiota bacterium]KAF0154454.1 MAG: leucyl-tRNA synthetase [Elusimicrobiota bacterium]
MNTGTNARTFQEIDARQQKRWEEQNAFRTERLPGKPKFYCLDMFPYPSGDGLHVGHPEGYTATDILCRYKRMKGFEVLHPMGWDAFGLPAENYAISTGVHPRITTEKNCATFKRQINSLGFSYDWDREIYTTDPAYYRWTQWIFLQLFKKGLAYEATSPINWCPRCKTGLANEEVYQGKCDRCETPIEKKNLRQWMLGITAYADRLLADLAGTDWPHSTMLMQKNWIGRSEGAEVDFALPDGGKLTVFTTRPDTLYGATYMVIAPEHPLTAKLTTPEQKALVEAYAAAAGNKSDMERTELAKEKTGVFTGAYAVNPVNGEKLPIWTADYVLTTYGTGAIMAVPAHDDRDHEFAVKFGLKIIEVLEPPADWKGEGAFCEDGTAINSGIIDGLPTPEAKKKITAWLEEKGIGRAKVNFKLRDWVFSRQHYWGEPIPLVHCQKCGIVPIPESELPLLLPEVEKYEPTGTGESPLAAIDSWVNTSCPSCGGPGKRETNTMPQWAGSCWYYLRYIDPKNDKAFVDPELEKAWMPVDLYIGGTEHAVLHLLYARFWHKVLFDLGHVSTTEPFKKLVHQGMILSYAYRDGKGVYRPYKELEIAEDGTARTDDGETLKPMVEKMSKSKKNVINPDEICERYGADAFRLYEMFMGPLEDSKPWNVRGIEGVYRFLKRAYSLGLERGGSLTDAKASGPDLILRHQTIEKVGADIEALKFNTAISALMVYLNRLTEQKETAREDFETFITLLHPFAPHIADEMWELAGGQGTLMARPWPEADKSVIASRDIEIPVQINGKIKERLRVKETTPQEELKRLALEAAAPHTAGRTIVKTIVVPGRLVSIVVK